MYTICVSANTAGVRALYVCTYALYMCTYASLQTPQEFARFAAVMPDDFLIVTATGTVQTRAVIRLPKP